MRGFPNSADSLLLISIQVFFNSGMTNNKDDFELCLRQENVELPKSGYFGVSAATGGLAGIDKSI